MAIDTLAPGTVVGERHTEGNTTFEWDGIAWFAIKDNLDNGVEAPDEVDSPAIIDSNGTPTLATGITGQEIRTLIGATDTDTTYRVEATPVTGGAGLRLDADTGQDTVVNFIAGDHATVTRTATNTIQISGAAPTDMGATVQERMALLAGVGTWTNITGVANLPAGVTLRNIGTDGYYCRVETRNSLPTLVAYTTFTPPSTFSGEYGTFVYSRPLTS